MLLESSSPLQSPFFMCGDASAPEGAVAMIENIVLLLICAALMVYLVYAMLRPERF